MIETYSTIRNGETVHLHRCRECSKRRAVAIGRPLDDNGFIPTDRPIIHLPGCVYFPHVQVAAQLPTLAPVLVDHMIQRRADTELDSRPRFHPRSGPWRKRRKK